MPSLLSMLTLHPDALQRCSERWLSTLMQPPGEPAVDFAKPAGEPALLSADSVSWQVFKNPLTVFVGGVAAVVLELAEPRICAGVWEHTSFKTDPMRRLARTAHATMLTVYGPRSQTHALVERVNRMHAQVRGQTADGHAYHALEPQLLQWVHATASFGFLEAHAAYVAPRDAAARDRFYCESATSARLYGVTAPPTSQAELHRVFEAMAPRLRGSPVVHEFLRMMERLPAVPALGRWPLRWLVCAAVDLVPASVRACLGLGHAWTLAGWQRRCVSIAARRVDGWMLRTCPPVQACRRLGLPDDHLHHVTDALKTSR